MSPAATGAGLAVSPYCGGAAPPHLRKDLTKAYLIAANLTRAQLTGANLTGAYLIDAVLREVTLTRARLTGAYLIGANLTRAHLVDADLTGANLTGANLTGAHVADAHLAGAVLTGARWPEGAQVPDGWMVDSDSGGLKPEGRLSEVTAHYL